MTQQRETGAGEREEERRIGGEEDRRRGGASNSDLCSACTYKVDRR